MSKRPNVLFLMSDEHRPDFAGYAGDKIVRTPVLDRIASDGVVFTNAYTPSPVCIPARQAMMAGQFPRHCGCEVYGQDLTPGYMTFSRVFSQHAYNTVVCGKLHHVGVDQMQGWTRRIGGDLHVDTPYIEGRVESEFQRYREANLPPHRLNGKEGFKWTDAKEIQRAGVGHGCRHTEDDYAIKGALDFIDEYFNDIYYDKTGSDRPLFLKVSLTKPHYPYFAKEDKFRYYLNRVKPFADQLPPDHPYLSYKTVVPGQDVTERDIRRAVAAYYAMIEELDDEFGRVLAALEEAGQNLDEWIIIYTSDHGEMLGEHSVWEKFKFYEGSAGVPLVIRYPKVSGGQRIVTDNVNLCDLFATLCDLAELPCPDGLDSRSMVQLMQGDNSHWDNETVSQFAGKHLMIKRDALKYQYYGDDMPEVLFDLERDPAENENVIDDPRYESALRDFRARKKELGF